MGGFTPLRPAFRACWAGEGDVMKIPLFLFGTIAFGQAPAQLSSYVFGPDMRGYRF